MQVWDWSHIYCMYARNIVVYNELQNGSSTNVWAEKYWPCEPTTYYLTHYGREDLWKWAIFNTILTSPKSWLFQEDFGCRLWTFIGANGLLRVLTFNF